MKAQRTLVLIVVVLVGCSDPPAADVKADNATQTNEEINVSSHRTISQADATLIDEVYTKCLETDDISTLRPTEQMVFLVESYSQEVNSGSDFIQWFRWTSARQVASMPNVLRGIGARESAAICANAIKITFPDGMPVCEDEYSDRLYHIEFDDEFDDLRVRLSELAERQIDQNYQLATTLAGWLRSNVK